MRIGWRPLFAVFLAVGTVAAVVLRWLQVRGTDLVPVPWALAVVLALIGVVVAGLGLRVRRWVAQGRPMDPLGAARTLVFGQAAAIVGAAEAGYFAANLALLAPHLDAPVPRHGALLAIIALAAALVLVAAGLFTQWCCRVPPADDEPPEPGQPA